MGSEFTFLALPVPYRRSERFYLSAACLALPVPYRRSGRFFASSPVRRGVWFSFFQRLIWPFEVVGSRS
jgi:hypothetical protein